MQPLPPPQASQAGGNAPSRSGQQARDQKSSSSATATRPQPSPAQAPQGSSAALQVEQSSTGQPAKKRKHRGGKKRRNNRQRSFAPAADEVSAAENMNTLAGDHHSDGEETDAPIRPGESFYKRRQNRSDESLESDALLDHRYQQPMRPRRESRLNPQAAQRASMGAALGRQRTDDRNHRRRRTGERDDDDSGIDEPTDRTPLMSTPSAQRTTAPQSGYGIYRSNTRGSSRSSGVRRRTKSNMTAQSFPKYSDSPTYDVNNPPSVPGSPHLNASMEDPMMPSETSFLKRSPDSSRNLRQSNGDALIDIDREEVLDGQPNSAPPSPRLNTHGGIGAHGRSMTLGAEDVCMPADLLSEMGEEDFERADSRDQTIRRRRRRKEWPQLWVLDEWNREEKEARAADSRRAQRVQEPVMIEGRYRPSRLGTWHREEAPNRFTYFNIEFESTIHAPSIGELIPEDCSFRDLFIPEPPVIEESSSSESDEEEMPIPKPAARDGAKTTGMVSPREQQDDTSNGNDLSRISTILGSTQRSRSQEPSRISSILSEHMKNGTGEESSVRSVDNSGERTPQQMPKGKKEKRKRLGERPQFWLDVLCPTTQEMHALKSAFGIHPLTAEDIMQQEAREKVELFKNYYFINYRTFEQDQGSDDYLDPVNMYILVFHHGILTFHFSQIPHPANVRRRIRQLQDYLELTADWISYAIIDDITDVFAPMIQNIEDEVDDIDEAILQSTPGAFSIDEKATGDHDLKEKQQSQNSNADNPNTTKKDDNADSDKSSLFSLPSILKGATGQKKKDTSGYDMLRRVGTTRKKVMGLYRLLGTKADVIKGFAKRCNEQWNVTPKNDIGLYLGDIQDHILTMTGNLSHYETLLSRAHSNYLAQVSIRMNERSEQTGDILNKLTVFGTIVLPMNIICGMWGMNVKVPGQDIDNLWWFWGITAGLTAFAVGCYLLCRKLYGIV